jgi:alkylhydroperoxidase/carboxymuconolactone decarboxylase family protein YurZ
MTSQRDSLRKLSLHDPGYVEAVVGATAHGTAPAHLDGRSCSLGRIAALFAIDGPESSYGWATSAALAAGVTSDELVDLLIAVAPVIGSARVVSAAPKLGLALGYDVEADLESLDIDFGRR